MVIGRESGDIILGDPETSALHAELEFTQGRVIVRDLGSRNGTLKDGKRLPQFALFAGQGFRCGATELVLLGIEGAGQTPSAGGTAAGGEQVDDVIGQSSATLEGGRVHESASTLPDSASPTIPGKAEGGKRTLHAPGGPPPPGSLGELKWDSGSGTYFGVDPKLDMVYLMMQQTQNERGRITPAFKALVYDCYPPALRRP